MRNRKDLFHSLMLAICVLGVSAALVSRGYAMDGSNLEWGFLRNAEAKVNNPAVQNVLQRANTSLAINFQTSREFHLEGTLNSDPQHIAADKVKENIPNILFLAVCARVGAKDVRQSCLAKAMAAIGNWSSEYTPKGDPIDEQYFLPLFEAADLIRPEVRDPQFDQKVRAWIYSFVRAGDQYYTRLSPQDTRNFNNWMAARLLIRSRASVVLGDAGLKSQTREMLTRFLAVNIPNDGGGRTYDFTQRDALLYHGADLTSLAEIIALSPSMISMSDSRRVQSGVEFMRPFILGDEKHQEFLHTTVAFDRERQQHDLKNPEFQQKFWEPRSASNLLCLSRSLFADLRWVPGSMCGSADLRDQLIAVR